MSAAHNSVRRRLLLGGAAVAGLAAAGAAAGSAVMARADFGALPTGERLKRIQASPHWQDGSFHNLVPMELSASGRSRLEIMRDFLLDRNPQRFPSAPVPHIKTHFAAVPDNHMVWLGHSGFFIHWAGLKVLIDPALHQAFPVPGFYKPFPGTDCWEPADLPAADLLLITHDHYDHLDYRTVLDLKNRVRRVVCPLGVGAHFEAWGWEAERITELDWQESVKVGGLTVSAVPAQHFSGRSFTPNPTLWCGYMLEADGMRIYHSGDTSFGPHFAQIAQTFSKIDLALIEDGQYDADWPGVHLMPDAWRQAAAQLNPQAIVAIHNSKFCLSHHKWTDPMNMAKQSAKMLGIALATPLIGEPMPLDPARRRSFEDWWLKV